MTKIVGRSRTRANREQYRSLLDRSQQRSFIGAQSDTKYLAHHVWSKLLAKKSIKCWFSFLVRYLIVDLENTKGVGNIVHDFMMVAATVSCNCRFGLPGTWEGSAVGCISKSHNQPLMHRNMPLRNDRQPQSREGCLRGKSWQSHQALLTD